MLVVLLYGTAHAWTLQDTYWEPGSVVAIDVAAESAPAGVPPVDAVVALSAAMATWNAVECAGDVTLVVGATDAPNVRSPEDDRSILAFDDPNHEFDQYLEPLPTITWWSTGSARRERFGRSQDVLVEVDIATRVGVWGSDADAADPSCTDVTSLQAALTHALGFALGLDRSDVAGATMQSPVGACDPSASTLSDDDIAALQANYGPWLDTTCTWSDDGLTVSCTSEAHDGTVDEVTWDFGDGTTVTAPGASHTFTPPVTDAVQTVCATWTDASCLPQCRVLSTITLEGTTPPSTTTEPDDTGTESDPPADTADPSATEDEGCGCRTTSSGRWSGLVVLACAGVRRRTARTGKR